MNTDTIYTRFNLVTLRLAVENLHLQCVKQGVNPEEKEVSVADLRLYCAATQAARKSDAEYESYMSSFIKPYEAKKEA